jgi:hypothetical protein
MTSRNLFLSTILAEEGLYCVVGLKKGTPKQQFVSTVKDVDTLVNSLVEQGFDAYFGCAKFETDEGRTAKNAKWFKSFWLDLDCGDGKEYATQELALMGLMGFCKTTGLPKPTIINSGRGIHAYWILNSTISYNEWKPAAEALKKSCAVNGLHADPSVTSDAARILRVPGTLNFKNPTNPYKVEILRTLSEPIDFAEFKDKLGVDFLAALPVTKRGLDATTRALMGNNVSKFATIMLKGKEEKGCPQLSYIYANQATVSEPLWRSGLSIAQHCEDRDTAIYRISDKHPDFNPVETDEKAAAIPGPHTCITFEKINPNGCEGCQHKGKISSPIQLGSEIAQATAEDNIVVIKNETLGHEVTVEIPEYPFPYFRGKTGGVYRRGISNPENEEEAEDLLVYEHDLYVVKRLDDAIDGESVWVRLHMPRDGIREFSIPLTSVLSKDKLREVIAAKGVAALNKQMDHIMAYLTKWVKELQAMGAAEKSRLQFGWTEENTFIIGDREIKAGDVVYSPPSSATTNLVPAYGKKGTLEGWKRVANWYARPGMEARAFNLFAGFGTPLLKFTNLKGVQIHLTDDGSGTGKTTIEQMINGIFGHPDESMLLEQDTFKSKMQRMGTVQNMPICIDEITNTTPEEVSNLAYVSTQGRGRNRMMSQTNAERINNTTWALILWTSGNRSVHDVLYSMKTFPEGELMRVVEINIPRDNSMTKDETDELWNAMFQNYGLAGEEYMNYIVSHREAVIEKIKEVQAKFDIDAGLSQRERFYSALAAVAIVGGMISNRLGLHNIDVGPVYQWAVKYFAGVSKAIKPVGSSPQDQLGTFLNEHSQNLLVINSEVDNRTHMEQAPIQLPYRELVTRYEPDTKLLFITTKHFRDWCTKNQASYKSITDALLKDEVAQLGVKKRLARGTKLNTPAVNTMAINTSKLENFDMQGYLPDENPK